MVYNVSSSSHVIRFFSFRYSVYFLVSEVLNFPFELMCLFENKVVHSMWPGPTKASIEQVQLTLIPLMAEIKSWDAGTALDPEGYN